MSERCRPLGHLACPDQGQSVGDACSVDARASMARDPWVIDEAAIAARYLAVVPAARRAGPSADGRVRGAGHRAGRGGGRGPGDRPRAHDRRSAAWTTSGTGERLDARTGPPGRVPDDHPSRSATRRCGRTSRRSSSRPPGATRSPRCAGRRGASGTSPRSCAGRGTRSATRRCPSCSTSWATACSPTARSLEGTSHPDRDAQFRHIARRGPAAAVAGRAGHQRGHQEEGARGALPATVAGSCAPRATPSGC